MGSSAFGYQRHQLWLWALCIITLSKERRVPKTETLRRVKVEYG